MQKSKTNTMNLREIFRTVDEFGRENTDPARIEKYKRYFKEGYDAYGLSHEMVTQQVAGIVAMPGMSDEEIAALSLLLVASPKYEMTVIAIQLMLSCKNRWNETTFSTLEAWFSIGITNWAQTDYICGELMNLFFKKGLVSVDSIAGWRTAENKFQRRAAAVSLIKPMKGSTDFTPWFDFIRPMMHDPAREVHQALGWFLREAWKKQPAPTEVFLSEFRETAPRLIFQYATEKMTAEGKERFRRNR
jgi:3-methyladenine DNA glycosylase AlkD